MADYGGESYSKKRARAALWQHLDHLLVRGKPQNTSKFLVIAGPEGADIRTLIALGVSPENIFAVDIKAHYIEASRKVAPGANYFVGDVFEFIHEATSSHGGPLFDAIFLDMCHTMSSDFLNRCRQAANTAITQDGILALGLMYGRESKETMRRLQNDKERRLVAKNAGQQRLRNIWKQLDELIRGSRTLVYRVFAATYRSGRRVKGKRGSIGVPMLYAAFYVHKLKRPPGKKNWKKERSRYAESIRAKQIAKNFNYGDDPDGKKLRRKALKLRKQGHPSHWIADLLNIKRQQVAAWLAWDTMRKNRRRSRTRIYRCDRCMTELPISVDWLRDQIRKHLDAKGLKISIQCNKCPRVIKIPDQHIRKIRERLTTSTKIAEATP